jgi:alpha-acetolactate decarboxylase
MIGLCMLALTSLSATACDRAPESTMSSASSAPGSASVPPVEVQTFGELHKMMQEGETGNAYAIRDALKEPHSFAIGALSGLRGEVTIRDGVVWLAYPDGDRARVERDAASPEQAALFVLSHVAHWQTLAISAPVPKAELDAFIESQAVRAGIDVTQPFPVRIEGPIASLDWHVIDGARLTPGGSHEDHKRAAVTGNLTQVDVHLIGFFGQNAQGVFTHMGERSHFHVIEPKSNTTGHVDDLEVAAGAQLMLPARAP